MDQWIELWRKIRNQNIPLRQLERETVINDLLNHKKFRCVCPENLVVK